MAELMQFETARTDLVVDSLVINLLDPLVDAGHVMQVVDTTVNELESVDVATFTNDVLFDYRAQRPVITYADGQIVELVRPTLNLKLVTDVAGSTFLYLCGQEPDFRWDTLAHDFLAIIERFAVKRVYSLAAMPAPVPHTRPVDLVLRSTKPREDVKYVQGQIEHYGALADYFEFVAGQSDVDVTNMRVRVPFYIAQSGHPYSSGAIALVKMLASMEGPSLPLGDLEQFEDRQLEAFAQFAPQAGDLLELIAKLEEEYDAHPETASFTMSPEESVSEPSFEEIGTAAERFLASLTDNNLAAVLEPDSAKTAEKSKEQKAGLKLQNAHERGPRRRGKHHY